MLVAARIRTLNEWHSYYNEHTGRIHGTFDSIGTWPGRMAHRRPNLGNVSAAKSIKYKGQYLKNLAIDLGTRMRRFWTCDDDAWLVGTDMEAAHVRLFAHYIDDKEFTQAVVSGDKRNGTDVHSTGARIFSHLGCDRDNHKTFIFSFFNGAGKSKVAEIFGCSNDEAGRALELYQERYPGLRKLKRGLDGRRIMCNDEHLMFAGMLQAGEAVVMKMANLLWRKELSENAISYRQVNLVHDEYITEVRGPKEVAERVGSIQARSLHRTGEALSLRCPLAGEYKIGKDWLSVH
jgi:DNA polymerase-1